MPERGPALRGVPAGVLVPGAARRALWAEGVFVEQRLERALMLAAAAGAGCLSVADGGPVCASAQGLRNPVAPNVRSAASTRLTQP